MEVLESRIALTNARPTIPVDIDDAPNVITEGAYAAGTLIGITAQATDPDGDDIVYSLGDDDDLFQIDPLTGVVTTAEGAIFDVDTNSLIVIQLIATDTGDLSSTRAIAINVQNAPAPAPSDSNSALNQILEQPATGQTVGITAAASDPGGGTVTYYLLDDADGRFTIHATSGVVTVLDGSNIDFESGERSYTIEIGSLDSEGEGDTAVFTIDVLNRAPATPIDLDPARNVISETTPSGAATGLVVRATEVLGGSVTYSLADSAGGRFGINAANGTVVLANRSLITDDAKSYAIRARATDSGGAFSEQTFVIQVQHNVLAAASASGSSRVVLYDAASHAVIGSFLAFAKSYKGGVRVATGDVNGDGVMDVAVTSAAGPKTKVQIYDGTKLHLIASKGVISPAALIASIAPFGGAYKGGAYVALADLNRDQFSEIIVGAGTGRTGEVRIHDGSSGLLVQVIRPFSKAFKGGVSVVAGDMNGDGIPEIAAAQASGGSQVRLYDGASRFLIATFKPLGKFKGGADVAIGDVNGDGRGDLVASAGPGSTPRVVAFSGLDYGLLADFMAYARTFKGGVQVATLDVDGDGRSEIVTGDGPNAGPSVRRFEWTGALVEQLFAGDKNFKGGLFVD